MNSPPLDKLVPEHIKRFAPYIPSKPDNELIKLYGCSHLFRLNNNENPLGPPEAAREVIDRFPAARASIYPSGDAYHLRHELAERFGLDPEQLLVGNGANEVIGFVIKAFCQEGDNIITADKTFAVYEWVAEFSGFEARLVPLVDFGFDDEEMLGRIDEKTKIVFICNPNNPTGSYWDEERLRGFLRNIAGRQIVVVDEAYCEFVEKEDYPDGIRLRIGYLAGDRDVVDIIRRTCVVYSVNGLAQEAALAALNNQEHINRTREMVREGKEFVAKELDILGLPFVHDQGNFMMIRLPMSDSLAYRKLMTQGVMVRTMTGFRFPNYIRLTISNMEAMEAFIEALKKIVPKGEKP
ncbi:MAG: aminotransferase class I/II-fold pyridoxal phosphate-dependent enzyme [Deltaproteobacteria bacterium]|nr:aminotransferase class I/II-fold pyridoxal phosphate-dependent enzyme [Deltaproteobacteria bacterium]